MRILHFSDLHIGVENYGRPVNEQDLAALPEWFAPGENRSKYLGNSTRLIDFLCAFDELVAYALEHRVDLVLFSGDAYKSRDPNQTHQREFAKRIGRLAKAGVPVFLLVGNHDLPHASYRASAIEIFDVLAVPAVTIAETLDVYRIETPSGAVQVLALPWVRRSGFLARDDIRNLPFDQIQQRLEQALTELLRDKAETLDPDIPAILAAHVTLNTAKLGTERTMMIGYDHVLLQSDLTRAEVDYIALGHIHRRQSLSEHPPAIYSGSLQRIDFGEEDHEEKGFYTIDLDPKEPIGRRVSGIEFHPVQARAFVTVAVTITEDDPDPTETVVQAIRRQPVANAIVRVQVKLPASQEALLRDREPRRALEEMGAHHVAAFTREVERPTRVRLGATDVGTRSPQELLGLYLETTDVTPERARTLKEYARRLMDWEQGQEESAGP